MTYDECVSALLLGMTVYTSDPHNPTLTLEQLGVGGDDDAD